MLLLIIEILGFSIADELSACSLLSCPAYNRCVKACVCFDVTAKALVPKNSQCKSQQVLQFLQRCCFGDTGQHDLNLAGLSGKFPQSHAKLCYPGLAA